MSCCIGLTLFADSYILFCTIFAFIILYPNGGLRAVDAFFFGASANTESGLNT